MYLNEPTHHQPVRRSPWIVVLLTLGPAWFAGCGTDDAEPNVDQLRKANVVPVLSIAVSPDGKTVACCNRDNTLTLRDRGTLKPVRTLKFGGRLPVVARFHPRGDTLLVGYYDGIVGLWDLKTPSDEPAVLGQHNHDIRAAAFSNDGRTAATGDGSGDVILWNTAGPAGGYRVARHATAVWSLAFSRDDRRLASGGSDGQIRLWDTATAQPLRILAGHNGPVRSLDVSRDGTILVSGGLDSTIRVWSLAEGRELVQMRCPGNGVVSAVLSRDANTIAAATVFSGSIKIWNVRTRQLTSKIPAHDTMVNELAFARDGVLVSCGMDGDVETWDVESDVRRSALPPPATVSRYVPVPTTQSGGE